MFSMTLTWRYTSTFYQHHHLICLFVSFCLKYVAYITSVGHFPSWTFPHPRTIPPHPRTFPPLSYESAKIVLCYHDRPAKPKSCIARFWLGWSIVLLAPVQISGLRAAVTILLLKIKTQKKASQWQWLCLLL